jgi:hypothetical protein
MLYAIVSEDITNSLEKRKGVRPAHLKRIQAMVDKGRVIVAGPHPAIDTEDPGEAGFTGSLIVAEFSSLDEAKAWANADPYVTAGVYSQVTVKPFKKILP